MISYDIDFARWGLLRETGGQCCCSWAALLLGQGVDPLIKRFKCSGGAERHNTTHVILRNHPSKPCFSALSSLEIGEHRTQFPNIRSFVRGSRCFFFLI